MNFANFETKQRADVGRCYLHVDESKAIIAPPPKDHSDFTTQGDDPSPLISRMSSTGTCGSIGQLAEESDAVSVGNTHNFFTDINGMTKKELARR